MKNKYQPEIRFTEFKDSWKKMNLEDVASKIGSGKTPRGGDKTYVSDGVPLLRSQNIYNDRVNLDNIAFIPISIDKEMINSRVQKDDVLLNITGASIGRSAVYSLKYNANVNQHVSIIRPINEVDPHFLQFNITSEKGQKQIDLNQAGGGREGLNFKQIAQMSFYFPSKDEQEKISKYLKGLDKIIYIHQKELETLKQTKQGFLQKMFPKEGETTPELRFPGFCVDWEQRKLQDLLKSHGYKIYLSKPFSTGKYVVIQQGDNPILGFSDQQPFFDYEDVVLFGDHTVSLFKPQNPFLVATDGLKILSANSISGDFLYSLLVNYKPEPQGYKRHYNILKNVVVSYPEEKEEQIKIGKFFKQLDQTIELHEKELEALKETKKAFLQKMFV